MFSIINAGKEFEFEYFESLPLPTKKLFQRNFFTLTTKKLIFF